MRILQVIHDFVPNHVAGAELYCFYLSQELARRHAVHVLYTEVDYRQKEYTYRRASVDGVTRHEVVRNHAYRRFEETYADPAMERIFGRLLDEIHPDVVHIHQLLNHSVNYITLAKARGIGVAFTLHDYWLSCPNYGQRLTPDRHVCERIEPASCAKCIRRFSGVPALIARARSVVMRVRASRDTAPVADRKPRARHDTGPSREALAKAIYRRLEPWLWAGSARARTQQIERRLTAIRRACQEVDLFIAPSAFMADKMREFGLPAGRVVHSPNGMRTDLFQVVRRPPSDVVRLGYVGAVSPHKGVHVLVEAFKRLMARSAPGRPVELRIHGNLEWSPEYVAQLRSAACGLPVHFLGEFDNRDAAAVYGELDVVVIPSVWWENAPLTLYEAILNGTPVVASDCGSLPHLLGGRWNGTTFTSGDPEALVRRLTPFVDGRNARRLRPVGVRVKSVAQDAEEMERRYDSLRHSSSVYPADPSDAGSISLEAPPFFARSGR